MSTESPWAEIADAMKRSKPHPKPTSFSTESRAFHQGTIDQWQNGVLALGDVILHADSTMSRALFVERCGYRGAPSSR